MNNKKDVMDFVEKQLSIHCRVRGIETEQGIRSAINEKKNEWVRMYLSLTE